MNAAVGPELGLAVDPVDPEGPGRVAVAVVADHVPVAEAQHDAVGLEVAGVAPVGERDGGVAAHRVEQHGEAGASRRARRARLSAPSPDSAAELGQALAAGVALEATAVTATCSAASSASVSSSSGR